MPSGVCNELDLCQLEDTSSTCASRKKQYRAKSLQSSWNRMPSSSASS